ncbi:MAG: SDR family oxidoreductase [Endozoicomonas sp. (ex Botrylloides leachii)]|nr:SDR family oxidoreductase [Endozoicomonas sp. (ex Botrylloides leachii)]
METKRDKTALITGASSGIGWELAALFAEQGINLILVARRKKELSHLQHLLKSKHGVSVTFIACDLTKENAVRRLYDEISMLNVHIDYLVNNAGVGDFAEFTHSTWNKNKYMIDLNIKALTELTGMYIPHMVHKGYGRILNVASTAAFQPGPLMAVYYATKAYVLSFSEAIAEEVKHTGITVTALCPGPTESEFLKASCMEGVRLIDKRQMPSSREVATFGYNAMMKGKVVAIHGTLNYLMVNLNRFFPRQLIVRTIRMIMKKKQ